MAISHSITTRINFNNCFSVYQNPHSKRHQTMGANGQYTGGGMRGRWATMEELQTAFII